MKRAVDALGFGAGYDMHLSEARVLVVDDEPVLCEIFAQWMKMAGCRSIRTAKNGLEALEAVAESSIDVLVTDVRMPGMDGVTLVRTLVERGLAAPTVIFVSGFGDLDQREMYGLGVEAFLSKPLRRDDLMEAVKRAVAARVDLWTERMEIAPRQTLDIEVRDELVRFGRGGFSAPCPGPLGSGPLGGGPLSLGRVTFRCRMDAVKVLAGQGFVRWYARGEERVGIEFWYLEESCREWVLEEMAAARPLGFVPRE